MSIGMAVIELTRTSSPKEHIPVVTQKFYTPGEIVVKEKHGSLTYHGIVENMASFSRPTHFARSDILHCILSVGSMTVFNNTSVLVLSIRGDMVKLRIWK